MRYNFYLIFIKMAFDFDFIDGQISFFPKIGEYQIVFKSIQKSNITDESNIIFNVRLNKKSISTTEIIGNLTFKVPLDDSFSYNVNMAVKDSITGVWNDNAHIIHMPKGCTSFKYIFNNLWIPFTEAFGININCPISKGTYVSKGFDVSNVKSSSAGWQSFFYGLYKVRSYFTDKYNNKHGCIIIIMELNRL